MNTLPGPHVPALAGAFLLALLVAGEAGAQDRHAGYYYPPVTSQETYVARAATLSHTHRARRILFTTEITNQMLGLPYPPTFAMFPKGEEAEKLIIVALQEGRLDTLYRMRALLAQLTARARETPLFREYRVEAEFTFLDLLKLLGFRRLTLSDGVGFAHQIEIQ